jgi:dTDP-4-amino-4,6-dideoxygalactose transaminase
MANGIYRITEQFEEAVAKYCGSPYCVAVDNQSNALFLSLMYVGVKDMEITLPNRTYPSVPCEVIHAGAKVKFRQIEGEYLEGAYQLEPTKVWDCALRFTHNMYVKDTLQCLSFTGAYKHLKLSKGGAILTDSYDAYRWLKRARYSGRRECNYHNDNLDMIGWNFYMMPELAARGLLLMGQFYDGITPIENKDKRISYPDLSQFKIYTQ